LSAPSQRRPGYTFLQREKYRHSSVRPIVSRSRRNYSGRRRIRATRCFTPPRKCIRREINTWLRGSQLLLYKPGCWRGSPCRRTGERRVGRRRSAHTGSRGLRGSAVQSQSQDALGEASCWSVNAVSSYNHSAIRRSASSHQT